MKRPKPYYIYRNLASAFFAVVLSAILLLLGRGIASKLMGVSENFYLKYYYDIVNGKDADGRSFTVPDSMTIINIQNYRNRLDIAKILEMVYEYNPCIIGVDVFFMNNPDIQTEVNQELIRVLKKVQDKTVLPCNYSSNDKGIVSTSYPFFYGEEGLDKLIYSSPVAYDFYGYYGYDDSSVYNKDTLSPVLPSMSYAIANASGKKMKAYIGDFRINYSKKALSQIIVDDISKIEPSQIKDKIVLIGDMSEIKDMTRLPFRFGPKKEISGVEDIAYSVINLLDNKRLSYDELMRFQGFRDWPLWASVSLSLLLSLLFSIFQRNYKSKIEIAKTQKLVKACCLTLVQPILFLLMEVVAIVICYSITFFTNALPDLFMSMIALGCVSVSVDFSDIIFPQS